MSSSVQNANWITPEEQLNRIQSPISISKKVYEISRLPREIANMIGQYAINNKLGDWYIGLKRIEKLPEKIPPLPNDIVEIFNKPCPKQICDKTKQDGASSYTLGEKCSLTLVPKELGTLNEFEKVVRAYGEKQHFKNENPLQFRYFWDTARQEHGDVPFGPTEWQLQTDGVLEGSRNKSYQEQATLVDSLSKKTFVNWQVPELRGTIATTFLKKIATGESLYEEGNEQNGNTYTRVKETTAGTHLVVGGFAPGGLCVVRSTFGSVSIGVAALRKF